MYSLDEIARQVMIEKGFIPDYPPEEQKQLEGINKPALPLPAARDMRDKLWVSIDNSDSRDLDQLTFAEKDHVFVAIADVDSLVKRSTPIDAHAAHNTTSVYTPTIIFPMLPEKLSTNLTSLSEKTDRNAIVIEIKIDADGQFTLVDLYPALVRNQAKLNYDQVASWLDKKSAFPSPELAAQLMLQDAIAKKIRDYRYAQGALFFEQVELRAVIQNGNPIALKERLPNRAEEVIENFMIAANASATRFLDEKRSPVFKRIVRVPNRWDRIMALAKDQGYQLPPNPDSKAMRDFLAKEKEKDPERFVDLCLAVIKLIGRGEYILALPGVPSPGHFDLALEDYAHSTAPNRRYPDLVMQRLIKSALYKTPIPYTDAELTALALHCTQKEDDASRVERRMLKSAAAMVLSPQIGHTFKAMVTGASDKGTWVRIYNPPIEGRLISGFEGLDVGDRLQVQLKHVDISKGFIDFARIKS